MNENILSAWKKFRTIPFPGPPSSTALREIWAELANISTFGSGCFHSYSQKGQLGAAHLTVLLNCLTALQRVEGKLAFICNGDNGCLPGELAELRDYKEALERFFETILIGCQGQKRGNRS